MEKNKDQNLRFIQRYERLMNLVNSIAGRSDSTHLELKTASQNSHLISRKFKFIQYIREIRHLLQHPQHNGGDHAIVVSQDLIDNFDELISEIEKPKTAKDLGVPSKDLWCVNLDARVIDVSDKMKSENFSQVPVIDQNDVLIGVFSESSIFSYFGTDEIIDASKNLSIQDIFAHCQLDDQRTEIYRFAHPNTPIHKIYNKFVTTDGNTKRLGAVFVTASGKQTEKVSRMITAWDVLASSEL